MTNLKNYSDLNGLNDSKQVVGLIIDDIPLINKSGHFFNILNYLNSDFYEPYVISGESINNFKKDLIKDKLFFDIIFIYGRCYDLNFLKILIEKCKLFNIKIIFDVSSDENNLPQCSASFNFLIKNSNGVIVPNILLKNEFLKFNNNVHVFNNYLSKFLPISSNNKLNNVIKIGCIYDSSFKNNLNIINNSINMVKQNINDKKIVFELFSFEDTSFGEDSFVSSPNFNSYEDYVHWIGENLEWDIIIFPFDDNSIDFNNLEFKYLESSILEAPGIYINLSNYNDLIVNKENGFILNQNSVDDLSNTIVNLINDENLRKNIVLAAQEDIEINFNRNNNFKNFLRAFHRNKFDLLYSEIKKYFENSIKISFIDFINDESEIILKNSDIFDEKYYLTQYSDVDFNDITPEIHYLNLGFHESCNPSLRYDNLSSSLKFINFINEFNIHPVIYYLLYGFQQDFKIDGNYFDKNKSIIEISGLFDSEFYLSDNKDVKNANLDPLNHYLKYGYKEVIRCPNKYFCSSFYKHYYLNSMDLFNPFTHYLLYGQYNNFKINPFDFSDNHLSNTQVSKILNHRNIKVSIIIPIFQYDENIVSSIKNIIKNTSDKNEIILLSYTYSFSNLNDDFDDFDNIDVIECEDSSKFYENVNSKISSLDGDLVFLNICTEVTNGWLDNLKIKAYSNNEIGIVSPLSNLLLDIFPEYSKSKSNVPSLSVEGLSTLIKNVYNNESIFTNFANGFCIYFKNNVLDKISFNINSFFSDDDKLSLFDVPHDIKHIIDDNTYVFHDISRLSSCDEKLFLKNNRDFAKNRKKRNMFDLSEINRLKLVYEDMFDNYDKLSLSNRILYILNEIDLKFTYDFLLYNLKEIYNFYFLTYSDNKVKLWNNRNVVYEWYVDHFNTQNHDSIVRGIYFNILYLLNIKLVHLDNFNFSSFDLVDVCNYLNIPIISNSYFNQNMNIFSNDEFFEKISINHLNLLNNIRLVVDDKAFEELNDKYDFKLSLINKPTFDNRLIRVSSSEIIDSINIFVPGNLKNKYSFFDKINELDILNSVTFHFLGDVSEDIENLGINHGKLNEKVFNNILNEISPDFIFICELSQEIFSFIYHANSKHIPIYILDKEILNEFANELNLVNILNDDIIEHFFNPFNLFNDKYYECIKDEFLSDEGFILKLMEYNQKIGSLYYDDIDYLQKISEVDVLSKDYVKGSYSDFDKFLSNSYVQPEIRYPFTEDDKACFAIMDNISDYLTNKSFNNPYKPLVSIIMPVYNRINVIKNAVWSVLNQSYENFELIIVDDCSTDGTRDLIKTFDDSRIKLVFNNSNKGPSGARNAGLNIASGKYVAYLDSDNEWDSNYISSVVGAFLDLPDADALYSGQLLYDESNAHPMLIRFGSMNKSLLNNRNFIDVNCFCHTLDIFKKLGGFNENLKRAEDWDFILKIANNSKIYSIPILLSKYYFDKVNNRISDFAFKNHEQVLEHKFFTTLIRNNNKPNKKFDFKLTKSISIIIPSFESLIDIYECISSILKLYSNNVEIIVVDNNSSKLVRYYLNCLNKNNNIKLIQNDINYGFTYAVNQGIQISNKDSDILLMNNDAILTENSLEMMQNYAYSLKDCGIIVPQQVLPGNTPTIKTHVPYATPVFDCDVNPSAHHKNIINMPIFHDGEVLELNFAPFFCTYIKRDVLDNSVGLDAKRGRHYRSDVIYSEYIRHVMGLKIYHVSDAVVYHKLQQATHKLKENEEEYDIMFSKNRWDEELARKLKFKRPLWDY